MYACAVQDGFSRWQGVCADPQRTARFRAAKSLDDYSLHDLIWNRPELSDRYFDDKTTVFGHTPTFIYGEEYAGKIITTDTWIDIDAGAGYGNPPVLLRLDDMELFS